MFFGFGLPPAKGLQLIAVDDIGGITATVFANPGEYIGKTLEIAGDEATKVVLAATFAKVIGRPVNALPMPMPEGHAPTEEQISIARSCTN